MIPSTHTKSRASLLNSMSPSLVKDPIFLEDSQHRSLASACACTGMYIYSHEHVHIQHTKSKCNNHFNIIKNYNNLKLDMMANACNPSTLGDRDGRMASHKFKPSLEYLGQLDTHHLGGYGCTRLWHTHTMYMYIYTLPVSFSSFI